MQRRTISFVAVAAATIAVLSFTFGGVSAAPPRSAPADVAPPEAAPPRSAPADVPAAKSPRTEAKTIYETRCTTCHGKSGKGDGPGAPALDPPPRNFTSTAWQKSVSDEHIRKLILGGGTAVGLSPLCPPNPDLREKRAVVNALVAVVRAFGTPEPGAKPKPKPKPKTTTPKPLR